MNTRGNPWLVAAGAGSTLAALAHLAVVAGGPEWYRWLGAGEPMARAAARGALGPPLITVGIAAVLVTWAAYAFAGAGMLRRLPLMRLALVAIIVVLTGRGLAVFVPDMWRPDLSAAFKLWSSLIVLGLAACFALGTRRAWAQLSSPEDRLP